jgi:serine/threonine protein kinase
MTWRRRLCMARQIASALQYLHGLPMRGGMLHRDLRTMNVVVTSDWTTKLTDVGMSKFVDQVSSRSAGTLGGHNPRWMAPEILREGPFTKASDVYGLGTILWELMVWQHPWENMHPVQVVFARTSSDLEVPPETEWDSLPGPRPVHEDTLPRFAALAARCLSVDPSTRPPISEIVDLLSEMEEQEPNTDSVCCVCLHNSPTMIMPKCFHLCLCEKCAGRPIRECPICRRAGVPQRVYLS